MFVRSLSFYVLALVVCSTIVFHCEGAPIINSINLQQYSTIQLGWTRDQITKLIGDEGKTISQSGLGNIYITTVQYTGTSLSVVIFIFQGSILYGKSQTGLDNGNYLMNEQQYNSIQIGWTRDQVTKLVNSSGDNASEAGTGNLTAVIVKYKGAGTKYGVITLGFYAGKIVSKVEIGFASTVNNKINLQQYSTIQIGWTQQQVVQLLGGSGTIMSESGLAGTAYQTSTIQYTGSQSVFSLAIFTFQGGKLLSKAQVGLDTGFYTMTQSQFSSIEIGWTRDQVTNFVGSQGSITSEAGSGTTKAILVRYTAAGSVYGNADLTFIDGKLFQKIGIGYFVISNTINLQQYTRIQIGWTQQQVTQLLGDSGTLLSQSGTQNSPYQMTMVQYKGSQSSFSLAIFTFQGGKLFSKAQSGLDTTDYQITPQQYNQLQIGWTRDQVTSLVGSQGNAISEAGTGTLSATIVQYKVYGTLFGTVSIGFFGGKLNSKTGVGFK
ncbi:unnamed protein product [Adineta ricciae]|uniref:Uncharacterized protein n=1 Tax=Adineta ricciae TaxID=249248 RepID=A0A816EHR7_ADIRI|nr:unnamed protein product [Adineta ricciae]CAF1646149.1 unnamed protein product [Adineta ricciae]